MQPHWDIFCRVIDNYGDIGVCWRLARQLRAEHGLTVRLWLDDLTALAPLCQTSVADQQMLEGIEVRHWPDAFPPVESADVVIEAFACELPPAYLQAMARRSAPPRWINLEYLSAEAWVEDCHGLASPHPTLPLVKHFFFPGFTPGTGGLLREAGLLEERDAFMARLAREMTWEISLFCYDTAPVGELLETWASGGQPVRCLVPPGKPLDAVRRHLKGEGPWQSGNLQVIPIPFLAQVEYDRFLWRCDVNFVRGEDSFVRAQWAARPFVWQIYPQQDDAHLVKLEAFLSRYTEDLPAAFAEATANLFLAWNTGKNIGAAWNAFARQRPPLEDHCRRWADTLAKQNDLAGNLVKFCDDKL